MGTRAEPRARVRAAALLVASASTATAFLAFTVPVVTVGLPVAGYPVDGDQCRVAVPQWGVSKAPDCAGD